MEIHALQPNSMGWEPNGVNNGDKYLSDDDDFESGNNSAKLYERSRIRALADEREIVQKKTFQKWINSHLQKTNSHIDDLYLDLRDGKVLLKLLELLSGERMPRATRGKMRIHCLENVDKSLNFLNEQHVHLENIGAHDIVDGNNRITLGLIWTIILRFQIQDIMIEEYHTSETKSAKDALLLWCQMKTAGYPNVNVRNFTTSWRDGLAFNALIHKHRPDLIDYPSLTKANPVGNLENAFNVAEDKLGLASLLDPQDVCVDQPDEKSIMTYVVSYYHYFNKVKADNVHSRRIGKVVNQAIETKELIDQYELLTDELLQWIRSTIDILDNRVFANSLSGVQQQLAAFNTYRTVEKPPKFSEKGNLEVLLFTIQSKMRANNQKPYTPKDSKLVSDINKAWEELETAEHNREMALREELIRQEKLEQLAARFDRKAGMREQWLTENQRLVSQDNFGSDLAAVEAANKKHEAIQTDILAYEERVNTVVNVANQLEQENYHDMDRISSRKDHVLQLWHELLELLRQRQQRLVLSHKLQQVFQEMIYLLDWIDEIKKRLESQDIGKHLMGVEELLSRHGLLEADIRVLGNRMNQVLAQAQPFIDGTFPDAIEDYKPADPALVEQHCQAMRDAYNNLLELAKHRKRILEESKEMWQFFWDMEDEEHWIKEKSQLMSSPDLGHDLSSVGRLLRKHKAIEEELHNRQSLLESQLQVGEGLIKSKNVGKDRIRARIDELKQLWEHLIDVTTERKQRLLEAQEFFQLMSDCDDMDSWMTEMVRVVSNEDVGTSLATTESLIKRHQEVMSQLEKYGETIAGLHTTADKICEYPDVDDGAAKHRLAAVEKRYRELLELAQIRQQRLLDALSMYKMFNVSDTVKTWIVEKEKLLGTLVPGDDIEELEVIRHRFDGFEKELANNAEKVGQVNALTNNLLSHDHPDGDLIQNKQDNLNHSWNDLADIVEDRRKKINIAFMYSQYCVECQETANWIKDKEKLIESTDDLGNDLEGIMQLQRKLGSLQRDLKAIEAKVNHLDEQKDILLTELPESRDVVIPHNEEVHRLWDELQAMLRERDARLSESSELQRFLQDLDHFQMWLSRTSSIVASEDHPKDLPEAEAWLTDHLNLKQEIDGYESEFHRLLEFGRRVTDGQTDAQYVFLHQRLNGLEDGWESLLKMWHDREQFLLQCRDFQSFFRDAQQVDTILSQQENFLSKEDVPIGLIGESKNALETAQTLIKQHENFMASQMTSDEKIDGVLEDGDHLIENGNYAAEKIRNKCDSIRDRRNSIRKRSQDRLNSLNEQLILHEFLQDVDDVEEWIAEKMLVASSDDSRADNKNIAARYSKFKAFEEEIAANKDKIEKVIKEGEDKINEHPNLRPELEPRLEELRRLWDELNETAGDKSAKLAEANREIIFDESAKSMMSWLTEVSSQVVTTTEEVTEEIGLVEINEHLKDQKKKDEELQQKKKVLDDMQSHASKLKEQYPDREGEFEEIQRAVSVKLTELEAPLATRRNKLEQQKRVRQFLRDIEDERDWAQEKLDLFNTDRLGNSLLTAQQLQRRHRMLATEVENHKPRVETVKKDGEAMIAEGHPQSDKFREVMNELDDLWAQLEDACGRRHEQLTNNETAQQYLFDAGEAEAWMGEQELYLMGEEKAKKNVDKDEQGANKAMKKHELLEETIENYGDEIKRLGDWSRDLIRNNHPESEAVSHKQARVDKMYAGLKELCAERRQRLEEIIKLFHLLREILDLEAWIQERIIVANSHEVGVDYEHCCLLRDKFAEFARDTNEVGGVRVSAANEMCDALIDQGHGESAEIAQWKDRINEAWADLLELIETRIQLLKAAWDLHKYFCDCQDVIDRLTEKLNSITEESPAETRTVTSHTRKHAAFEYEMQRLGHAVEGVVETANHLLPSYSSEQERHISDRRDEVIRLWKLLQRNTEDRKGELLDMSDFQRFGGMVKELCDWMQDMRNSMKVKEKPKDVSGVELLMNNHRSTKAEIDAREENFSICLSLGRTLLHRQHPKSDEVREGCIAVVKNRLEMEDEWKDRWEELQLQVEVYQFARDAAVAESWLGTQEVFLSNQDLGESLDETDNLLKKHDDFEKSAKTQTERFQALSKPTTFEIKEQQNTPELQREKEKDKQRRIDEVVKEFLPPPPQPIQPQVQAQAQAAPLKDTPSSQRQQPQKSEPQKPISRTPSTSRRDVTIEAALPRKHEWESGNKKSSSRSWHDLYIVLSGVTLAAYKDQRHFQAKQEDYYRHEQPVDITGAFTAPANDYTKRPNVFRLKLKNGGEFLFQAHSEAQMRQWINALNTASGSASGTGTPRLGRSTSGAEPGKSSTLPPGSPHLGESGGKKKFFTIGRKK